MEVKKQETLLEIRDLCQYFGSTKAVDGVSFDIKKGEVFGLVGESGCGKTTTGRSIIKIYDITSGSIYFKGQRICAGTKAYRDEIAKLRREMCTMKQKAKERIVELRREMRTMDEEAQQKAKEQLVELRREMRTMNEEAQQKTNERIVELQQEIRSAIFDHKYSDREYAKKLRAEVEAKYAPLLEAASSEERAALKEAYHKEMRVASKTRLTTQIQMIFQDPIASLNPRMTVKEIISEGLVINGITDKAYIEEKVYEILELVGLVREHAGRYPHEFSGGQRQRIGIARAVIMHPELLIADEPISALDVSIQAQVINLLNELREKLGLTILFIAHDLSVVKYFSDRIGVMYYGHLVELAEADALFAHPLHPYTKSLLSAIPLPDPIAEKNRKRIYYNQLAAHDYSEEQPILREILPGHFVRCNSAEEEAYRKELGL